MKSAEKPKKADAKVVDNSSQKSTPPAKQSKEKVSKAEQIQKGQLQLKHFFRSEPTTPKPSMFLKENFFCF
jgi:hypothetical protein